jgi:uncharacterized membrane protein
MLHRALAKIRNQQRTTSCEERTMRKITMIAATAVITALITAWTMYPISTTSPAMATASPPLLNIMQFMRNAKDLPVESYDACACAF